ncbi:protein CURVATURE THYLAKOID 1D, chloroplastic [Nicotiana tabacum]|uniref:Protein CURVATURE THYLAKOID 1D, chloroplastic n=1 Tax=Nicotiana tabacum TaxID=4097 RepID=A0A1S3ZZB0_TOBAC|nr:PREDICTED: protein CURVATURE THYLAKOID 1D, chloroplastic-like [Nicotiana tabacum]
MELCTPQTFSKLPNHRLINPNHAYFQWKPSLLKKPPKSRFNQGLLYRTGSAIRATSEESSSYTSPYELYVPPKDDGAVQGEAPIQDTGKDKETDAYATLIYEPPKVEEKGDGVVQAESTIEESPLDFDLQFSKLFDKLNIKFDPEDSSSLILYGGGVVTALWLTTAIVGAIDSIPLFPKLLEVVGLGYTVWFSTRYLLFKKNRDELAAKIEELKQEVLGSNE